MKKIYSVNPKAAPKEWTKFRRWHKAACTSDPMTATERFIDLGGVIPKKNVSKTNPRVKKAK